ncbi:hypothetical protein GBAR_LOCUS21765 [Geodia barretti]|uniref:Secreted protein n=1 Tax=Geodia barretti TaxID=519541 RepID=A0AA35T107_GEOBA|nr:hypothetical protein GBAR_LOCUS21765 [Geodia barretti]
MSARALALRKAARVAAASWVLFCLVEDLLESQQRPQVLLVLLEVLSVDPLCLLQLSFLQQQGPQHVTCWHHPPPRLVVDQGVVSLHGQAEVFKCFLLVPLEVLHLPVEDSLGYIQYTTLFLRVVHHVVEEVAVGYFLVFQGVSEIFTFFVCLL